MRHNIFYFKFRAHHTAGRDLFKINFTSEYFCVFFFLIFLRAENFFDGRSKSKTKLAKNNSILLLIKCKVPQGWELSQMSQKSKP